jgi:hypothetical protein
MADTAADTTPDRPLCRDELLKFIEDGFEHTYGYTVKIKYTPGTTPNVKVYMGDCTFIYTADEFLRNFEDVLHGAHKRFAWLELRGELLSKMDIDGYTTVVKHDVGSMVRVEWYLRGAMVPSHSCVIDARQLLVDVPVKMDAARQTLAKPVAKTATTEAAMLWLEAIAKA